MAVLDLLLADAWPLFLLCLMTSAAVFPLVFVMSFVYSWLASKYKTPKVVLMFLVTFLGTLTAALCAYFYVGLSLAQWLGK